MSKESYVILHKLLKIEIKILSFNKDDCLIIYYCYHINYKVKIKKDKFIKYLNFL